MAGFGLLALIDDLATLLDDVASMTKIAIKKTVGVIGDDLAVNAEQVRDVRAERELAVVWAVAKGSLINKAILVPAALLISATLPWLITPILMLGGIYLCFEGFEKVAHRFLHTQVEDEARHQKLLSAVNNSNIDILAYERKKIKGAIRTDFVLSAEIIVIALGVVQGADLLIQTMVVSLIALLITISVYSLVAGIVKFDDAGLALIENAQENLLGQFEQALGRGILFVAPKFMQLLSLVGTTAMFLVGGGILTHNLPFLYHLLENQTHATSSPVTEVLFNAMVGFITGAVVLAAIQLIKRKKILRKKRS